jgi:hypothetical protein
MMSISYAMRLASRFAFGVFALASLCATAYAQSEIKVLSSRPDSVSGGDAVIQVRIPSNVPVLQVVVLRNGVDVTSAFVAKDLTTLEGLVGGLNVGANVILVKTQSGAILTKALVQNGPIYGPIFAGAHQRPWICETLASGLGPPPATGPCVASTRYDWFYKSTAGTFAPLPSLTPPFPADLAQTTTIDGNTVNYIVRVESGVIDESIYRIAIIDDPTNPISNPWSTGGKKPGIGWNGKLFYHFLGGCGPAFRSGRNLATNALNVSDTVSTRDEPLQLGFAVAFGTRNTLGTGCDDIVSAETVSMIKERFIEQYGLPLYTVGLGSSGGAMQQHLIAHNYPGLLDALTPVRNFPDTLTVTTDVIDCGLLNNYFNTLVNPADWPGVRRSKVDGYPVNPQGVTNCNGQNGFARQWPVATAGFDAVVPLSARYDPVTNRSGARGTYHDGIVNAFGMDPATGFARRPWDNVGVQYGLRALNSGDITKQEFLDLNARIGGLDVDGNFIGARSEGDLQAIANAYRSGRVNEGENLTLPVIQYRNYADLAADGIHTYHRARAMIERMQKTNGTADNVVRWIMPENGTVNFMRMALLSHDQWQRNIAADLSSDPYPVKVIRNKPASLTNACWDASATMHQAPASFTEPSFCNDLFPVHDDPRIVAGAPTSGDILKCQLKPVTASDYTVTFTPAELVRLNAIFPQGVCDWTKPGIGQQPIADSWLRYFDRSGAWARMGHTSFGN